MHDEETNVVYREGETPEPVTSQTPLEELETEVLRVWLDSSRAVRKAHQVNPQKVEQAVRQKVHGAWSKNCAWEASG